MKIYIQAIIKSMIIFLLIQNIYNTHKYKSSKILKENEKNNIDYKDDILNNIINNNYLGNQNESIYNIANNILDKNNTNKYDIDSLEYSKYYSYGISYVELKKYFEYINLSKNGIFLYKENLVKSDNPKISVIISVYNREKFNNLYIFPSKNIDKNKIK